MSEGTNGPPSGQAETHLLTTADGDAWAAVTSTVEPMTEDEQAQVNAAMSAKLDEAEASVRPTVDELRDRITITPSEWSWKATTKGAIPASEALKEGDRIALTGTGWVDSFKVQDGGAIMNIKLDAGSVTKVADRPQPSLTDQDAEPSDPAETAKGILEEHIATCADCLRDTQGVALVQPCPAYVELAAELGIPESWGKAPPEEMVDGAGRWDDLPTEDNELP